MTQKIFLPDGVWDNPEPEDKEAYENFVESWTAAKEGRKATPTLRAASYGCDGIEYVGETESGGDDGSLIHTGVISVNNTPVVVGTKDVSGTNRRHDIWLVFENFNIPKYAKINSAVITFQAKETSSATTLEANIDASTIINVANVDGSEAAGNDRTTAKVEWSIPQWTAGVTYTSPDISVVIEELCWLDDWQEVAANWCDVKLFVNSEASLSTENNRNAKDFFTDSYVTTLTVCYNYGHKVIGGFVMGGTAPPSIGVFVGGGMTVGGSHETLKRTVALDGGCIMGGESVPSIRLTVGGGFVVGEEISPKLVLHPSGGVLIERSPFPNGYHYRQQVCIHARETEVSCFPVVIRVKLADSSRAVDENDFRFETLSGGYLPTDGRIYSHGCFVGVVKTDLLTEEDCIYLYYGSDV